MMPRCCAILVALLPLATASAAASAAWGQVTEPHVCETAANTPAVDLGSYRGPWLVRMADGGILGHDGWHTCRGAPNGPEKPWESCNFSLCGLRDGGYYLQFADGKAAPGLAFRISHGYLDLAATKLAVQTGNYGVDATGSRQNVAVDLAGYALDWSIAHWPGPFHGGETHGRAVHDAGRLVFAVYPGGDYALRVGGAAAQLHVAANGALTAGPAGGPLTIRGNVAWLRVAPVLIMPPGPAAWSVGGATYDGPQTLMLPANAKLTLSQGGDTVQDVTLDTACKPAVSAGPFKVAAAGAIPAKSCAG